MVSNENPSATQTDLEDAIQLIMTGKDPGFAARVEAETKSITEEIERKHGVLNSRRLDSEVRDPDYVRGTLSIGAFRGRSLFQDVEIMILD